MFGGGGLTNEKAYLLGKFARVALGSPNIDYNGRFRMSSAATAANAAVGLDRENARYLERTYGFVERIGIDRIRAVVVASEGMADRLDAAMQTSVDAYYDPRQEADHPVTAGQLASPVAAQR